MVTYDLKLSPGIFGGSETRFNSELITHAIDRKNHIPGGYYPAAMTKQYLENDFEKFRKAYTWCPDDDRWEMTKQAFELIFQQTFDSTVLTFEEAIPLIELSASPGFPWNRKYATKRAALLPQSEGGSLELIKSIVDKIFIDGEVDFHFEGVNYTECFWLTSPKSEIRVISKITDDDVSKRKTRTFMCGDLITHIVGFMLYKNQNDNLLRDPNPSSWVGVGLNPYFGGWDTMARVLTRNNPVKMHCADASHMEASLSKPIQDVIYENRNKNLQYMKADVNRIPVIQSDVDVKNTSVFPDPDEKKWVSSVQNAKTWFFGQVSDSLIIDINGRLCQKYGKNPSGSFNTLTDNTFALVMVFLYAISEFCNDYTDIFKAYMEIACKMLGDDSIAQDDYRLKNLFSSASDLGFNLAAECPPGPLDKATFLSSSFYLHPDRNMWIQKPNFEKLMANVFFNFKKSSWRYAYVKLCAARKLSFAFPDVRREIDDYLKYVMKYHYQDMVNESHIDKELTLHATLTQYMPDSQNDFLIFGDECGEHISMTEFEETISDYFNKLSHE